jgi:hypothetical protein
MARKAKRTPVPLNYRFTQRLRAPAAAAFGWCVDFGPGDGALFSGRHSRSVEWLGKDTAILADTTWPADRALTIHRLVRIDRATRTWTNTHLDGPYQHSQYWYRVVPRGPRASVLEFTGKRLLWLPRRPAAAQVRRLTEAERRGDAATWRSELAPALARDLAG